MLITLAQGIAFPNVLAQAIAIFPDNVGLAASLQGAGMLLVGFLGLSSISIIVVDSGFVVASLYAVLLVIFQVARKYLVTNNAN